MDPALESEPRPDTPAAGNALVWMTLSLFAFGVFLVAVPGRDPAGRTWLWVWFPTVHRPDSTISASWRHDRPSPAVPLAVDPSHRIGAPM